MFKIKKIIFDYSIGIFLTLLPIVFVPFNNGKLNGWVAKFQYYQLGFFNVQDVSSITFLFMGLGVFYLFTLSLFIEPVRKFKDFYVGILFLLCLLNLLLFPIGIKVFSVILLVTLFYYIVYTRISSYKAIIYPICIVAAVNTLFAVLQVSGIQWFHNTGALDVGKRIDGLMFLSSYMAFYQAIATPICYFINPWLIVIPLTGIILSGSYVPLIAVVTGMSILLRKKLNLTGIPFLAVYSLISIYLLFNWKLLLYKAWLRIMVWRDAMDITWFGHSFKTFNSSISAIGTSNTTYSLYLTIFYYIGIIGLIFFFLMVRRIFNAYLDSDKAILKRCAFTSFLIILFCGITQSFIDFPRLVIPSLSVMLLLNLALFKGEENGIYQN